MEEKSSPAEPLRILMACGVPKRREGGVAAIVYNLGREMQRRGLQVTYVFLEGLVRCNDCPARQRRHTSFFWVGESPNRLPSVINTIFLETTFIPDGVALT